MIGASPRLAGWPVNEFQVLKGTEGEAPLRSTALTCAVLPLPVVRTVLFRSHVARTQPEPLAALAAERRSPSVPSVTPSTRGVPCAIKCRLGVAPPRLGGQTSSVAARSS
jgi:hypothetical protein